MNMNAEMIFNEFTKYVESDDKYYTWGKHGVIEDVLAWFNIPSGKFIGASSSVHADNLEKLHNFMVTKATDDQLKLIANICKEHMYVPVADPTDDAAG